MGKIKPISKSVLQNANLNKRSCKYLRIYINENLVFKNYIQYRANKLNMFCGVIYKVRHIYPRKCLLMFYSAYAKSVMGYEILSYDAANKTNLAKLMWHKED